MRLVSTLGWSPDVVLYPMKVLRPEEAMVIYGSLTEEDSARTEEAIQRIKENYTSGKVRFVRVDPMSLRDNIEKIEREVRITDDTVVNITGGTKVMSFALALLATMRRGGEVPVIYVVTDGKGAEERMRIVRIPLALSGTRVNFKKNRAPAMILKVLAENDGAEVSNTLLREEVSKRLWKLGVLEEGKLISQGAFSDAKKPLICYNLISERVDGRRRYYSLKSSAWFFLEILFSGGDAE